MRIKFVLLYVLLATVVSACSNDDVKVVNDYDIALRAAVVNIESSAVGRAVVSAKDNEYRGEVPTSENPLDAKLLFSLTSGDYHHATIPAAPTFLPCHTTIQYTNGLMTIPEPYNGVALNTLRYPTTNENVYCVGVYPVADWTIEDDGNGGTAISRDIVGNEDLMFAPQIAGSWNSHFGTQNYNHILSWVKVIVCATDQDVLESWGKITQLSISSASKVNIGLSGENAVINYTGSKSIDMIDDTNPTALKITNQEVGNVFCSPTTTFTVNVATEFKPTPRSVTISIPKDIYGNTITEPAGRLFILTLYFNKFDIITGVCTLSAWNSVNENLYLE